MIKASDYINTVLRYADTKYYDLEGEHKTIYKYILDKRFIKTNDLDVLQQGFPYCKLEHLDDYWIGVFCFYPLNVGNMFYNLLSKQLIVPIEDFLKYI